MNRWLIAQIIAGVGTLLSVIGIIILIATKGGTGLGAGFITIGFLIGVVSFFFGGFLHVIKVGWNIAKWGWIIVPFPLDLMVFPLTFIYSILLISCFPIIPVRKAYKEYGY